MRGAQYFGILVGLVLVASTTARPSSGEVGKRLIKTSENEPAVWLTDAEVLSLIEKKITFMDITERKSPIIKPNRDSSKALPTALRFESVVRNAFTPISASRIESFIVQFSEFHNRHYQSPTGVQASNWLVEQVRGIIRDSAYNGETSAIQFAHSFAQSSVVARIWGTDPALENEIVVLGGHMDSLASGGSNSSANRAPGADDNASGSGALIEAFRALLESGFFPKRTIEFHWYAGEEPGLLGSQHIASVYSQLGVNVISMMNFDVVGYNSPGNTNIRLVSDNTNAGLNQLLQLAIEDYLGHAVVRRGCGYGCSDHASWNAEGVPAASPMEPVGSPYMHTTRDTVDTLNYAQIAEFSKLAVAYSIEIAEPNN